MAPERDIYTHGHHEAVLRSHRWRTVANSARYLEPLLRPGVRLLDIGCGPGTLTADLAARVAPGEVVAVDIEPAVVDAAREEASGRGLTNVTFAAADFRNLDQPAGSFDIVHAHQVLQHLRDPVGALQAMARFTKPGGVVAARDSDYSSMIWSPAHAGLDRWLEVYLEVVQRNGGDPDAGRLLLHWARQAGLADVVYSTSTWTYTTAAEVDWWSELWARRVTESALAQQAIDYGVAGREELEEVAAAWRAWASQPDAVFVVVHGEIIGSPSAAPR